MHLDEDFMVALAKIKDKVNCNKVFGTYKNSEIIIGAEVEFNGYACAVIKGENGNHWCVQLISLFFTSLHISPMNIAFSVFHSASAYISEQRRLTFSLVYVMLHQNHHYHATMHSSNEYLSPFLGKV